MIYSNLLKKHYSDWPSLEKAIEALPTAKARGNVFEEFTFAYFTIKKQMYQIAEIYPSADIPDKYRKAFKLGNKQHQDSGVDGLIITNEGKSIAYQCKFRSGRVKPTYEELTKFWSDGRYCDYCCTVANSFAVSNLSDKHEENLQILAKDFDSLDQEFFDQLYDLVNNENAGKNKVFYEPYDYQKRIIKEVLVGFSVENRGKVIAACGTGKTLSSLWIVEAMKAETVLFLAPSISLVKQTLEAWADQAKIPFTYLCVCSDNTVSSNIDDDEAHRTAGLRSNFSLALEDQFICSKKRLFMTATERMVRPLLKRHLEENGKVIFSMDDENVYGPLFSQYNFGAAIKDKTISDYKIVVAGVKESEVYNYIAENKHISVGDLDNNEKTTTAEILYSKILLAKAMGEFPIKKTISFHSSIRKAKDFVAENSNDISLSDVIREFNEHITEDNLFIDNINCQLDSGSRAQILNKFKNTEYSVISNAKCLTEGVDVPIIDSVYFIDRKKSLVDIVQACGRALRTQNGIDKTAYFIIPILIPESSVAEEILNSEEFEIVYNIIQALRSQDNRLEDWINRLNNEYVRTGRIGSDCTDDDVPIIIQIEGIDIKQFSDELYVQIATVNANPDNIRRPTTFGAGERKTGHARIFKTIGDYAAERFFSSLVDPTIKIYKDKNSKCLSIADIKIDNNNISHTYRLGLIEKSGKNYSLTPLGEYYLSGRIKPQDLFRKQMLRYSNSLEDNKIAHTLFPYRACLEVLKNLEVKKLTFNEFAFCIYPMYDSTPDSIKRAVDDINYLRQKYPRLKAINIANRPQILQLLNTYFGTTLTITDIWGTAGTTVKNLYSYFKNHLSLFEDIIEIKNREICIKPGVNANDIDKLLEIDKNIEKVDRKNLFAIYTEVSSCL